ncbi:AraC family transcriptional regulator [Marinobacter sp.]|uniref:AraC family transcriptional regulator n=1 Tax=Marinobacter sp. TaxID=50741 RepID=UPI0034A139D5
MQNIATPALAGRQNSLGDISVLYVSVLMRAVSAEGHDPFALMERFRLTQETLTSPDARISIPRFMRLGQAAIELTGNRAIGLTMGSLTRPVDAGLAGLAAQAAPTTGEALTALIRYSLLTSRNSRGAASTSDNGRQAHFYSIRPYNVFNYFVVDSVMAAWTSFLRTISGRHRVLERVAIEYPSIGLDATFEQWFGCPVQFGASSNALTLAQDIGGTPSLQAQPAVHTALTRQCDELLQKIRLGWTTRDRVRDLLTPLLQGVTPSLETIAARLGIAPWTLRRQLADEQTGFRELVDQTRKDLAAEYIRETKTSLAEIAWLLGFANPAAFHKAYRRWFDISPGEHRKQFHEEQTRKGIR